MTQIYKIFIISLLLVFHYSSLAESIDLFELSLEELMQITVASKSSENRNDAAGVINVISADDITRYGARNLRDVIDRVVNTQVIGSNLHPHNRISMRGVTQTHTDNNVLLLLNGNVIRDGNTGGEHSDIYNMLPLQLIKRIEIIRGPGSVIYGSNAFAGVLNIITYDGSENDNRISATVGSYDSQQLSTMISNVGDDYKVMLGVSYLDAQGDLFKDIQGEFGTSGDYPMDKNGYQLTAVANYGGFSFNALYSETKQGHVKSLFQFPSSTLKLNNTHLDIAYLYEFFPHWQLNTHVTYNDHEFFSAISNSRDTRTDSQDIIVESILTGKVTDDIDVILGVNHETIKGIIGKNTNNETPFNSKRLGMFAQTNWKININNSVVLGLQRNDPDSQGSSVSPRFAYIYHFNSNWTLKALYGEAFRSPFGAELFLNSLSLKGNPDLRAETIKTIDGQLIRQTQSSYSAITLYKSKHEEIHHRENIDGTPTFINSGVIDYYGIELESKITINNHFVFEFNGSYQQNENEEGLKQTTFNPEIMLKVGLGYESEQGYSLSVFNSYFSASTQLADINITPSAFNKIPRAYNLLTANLLMDVNRLFDISYAEPVTLALYIDNILNEAIYFTSFNRTRVNSLPHHAGRGFYLSLNMEF